MKNTINQAIYAIFGAITVALWIALFLAATNIDSKPYRDKFATVAPTDPPDSAPSAQKVTSLYSPETWGNLLQIALLWTPTNAAILTCLAGLAGGISSNLTFREQDPNISSPYRTENPIASLTRSFLVYLVFVAGVTIASPQNPFENTTASQYLRVAGMLSLLGFVVGYDPLAFRDLLEKIPRNFGGTNVAASGAPIRSTPAPTSPPTTPRGSS